jgi:hypothetical protein
MTSATIPRYGNPCGCMIEFDQTGEHGVRPYEDGRVGVNPVLTRLKRTHPRYCNPCGCPVVCESQS